MEQPQHTFAIGDQVFQAGLSREKRTFECPDCQGIGIWKATSPVGDEYSFSCPRCCSTYISDKLEYYVYTPDVRKLTIGHIEVKMRKNEKGLTETKIRYMAEETGIRTGPVYDSELIFASEEAALAAAEIQAAAATADDPDMIEHYNKTLTLSSYQLSGAQDLERLADFNFCPEPALRKAWELVRKRIPAHGGYDPEKKGQIVKARNFSSALRRLSTFFNRGALPDEEDED